MRGLRQPWNWPEDERPLRTRVLALQHWMVGTGIVATIAWLVGVAVSASTWPYVLAVVGFALLVMLQVLKGELPTLPH